MYVTFRSQHSSSEDSPIIHLRGNHKRRESFRSRSDGTTSKFLTDPGFRCDWLFALHTCTLSEIYENRNPRYPLYFLHTGPLHLSPSFEVVRDIYDMVCDDVIHMYIHASATRQDSPQTNDVTSAIKTKETLASVMPAVRMAYQKVLDVDPS